MITIRKAEERGHFDHGWLDTRHTFSFADYHDPSHMGFRGLRVVNEDRVQPGEGFPQHGHRDMEILSYVLSGALAHDDSTGGKEVLRPGEVQRMTAGTGVRHSEYNGSDTEPVHFLQIWILPDRAGHAPSYEQKPFPDAEKRNRLRLVAAPDGAEGALRLHADVRVYATVLEPGARVSHPLVPGRHAWLQVARGELAVNGKTLRAGDGAAVSEERELVLAGGAGGPSEALLFDLA
jgi:redox-sensitive bicupin YhaK (pirin superfamily)